MLTDTLHLRAPGNWINDPNGFIYYKGQYHLFYQYFPYAPQWGTMHWGHAISPDLVHWEHKKVALFPTKAYDQNGAFSGSALEKEGNLHLYYSAIQYTEVEKENIHVAKDEHFITSQAMLISQDGKNFDNWNAKKQIIPVSKDETLADKVHTRDPKVWKEKEDYYMVLGSTLERKVGRVLFYKSKDGLKWDYVNQYQNPTYGSILECPDLFSVDETYVFMCSPMDIMDDGLEYAHHAVCAIAQFDPISCELQLPDTYQFVDGGLDLYAPQTNIDKEGRRIMIGWMRMPEAVYETEDERGLWNGMMSLPRVVEVEEGHISFRVHPEVDAYFSTQIKEREQLDYKKPYRLQVGLQDEEEICIGGYRIWIEEDCVKTDRSSVFHGLTKYRNVSSSPKLDGKYELDIFVEPHMIELFINSGIYVISNVVYDLQPYIKGNIDRIFVAE